LRSDALDASLMHASIWRFVGDPVDLLRRYDAMAAEEVLEDFPMHHAFIDGRESGQASGSR
jgi:hypothetical protein